MKQILILPLTILLLSSCDEKNRKTTQTDFGPKTELKIIKTEKKQDTIYNYWELILDTISDQKAFKVLNKNYTLELKTFSLNDSLIIRNLGQREPQVYLDHAHTMITDFKLITDSIVDQKRIDRTNFVKSLIPEFYVACNLLSTEIDSIVGDIVYLTSALAVPDTDNQWRVWYLIRINKNRLGNIEITESDYVGM
jgi:hypothetical protein